MNSALFHNNNDFSFLNNSVYWNRYDQLLNGMSLEQKTFVSKNEKVLQKKSEMMNAFLDYLFEQYKDSFVSVQGGIYQKIADEYIETVRAAGDNFVTRAEELEKENEDLKRQIKKLMEKENRKNGKDETTADRIG